MKAKKLPPPVGCLRLPGGVRIIPRLEQDRNGEWRMANAAWLRELLRERQDDDGKG